MGGVGADNLRIDLNGYTLTTQHVWGTQGVRSAGFKGIEVVGPGRIENFSTGVALAGGTLHEVRGIEVASPTGTSIVLRDASAATTRRTTTRAATRSMPRRWPWTRGAAISGPGCG